MEYIEFFTTWLNNRHTISETTRKTYLNALRKIDFHDIHGSLRKLKKVDSDATYNLRIVALKNLAKAMKQKNIDDELISVIGLLERIRFVRSEPHKPYSKDQVKEILDITRGWKRHAILIALYAGLRQQEIQGINIVDIDFKEEEIIVRKAKGNKIRKIPIPVKLLFELKNWLRRREKLGIPGNNWLFTTFGSRPNLASGGVFRNTNKKIDYRITWHRLRATYAITVYQESNHDIRLVQLLLGHESIATTERYLTYFDSEIKGKVKDLGDFYK